MIRGMNIVRLILSAKDNECSQNQNYYDTENHNTVS